VADYHAHPAVPITSHTKRPNNPQDYTMKDGERRLQGAGRIKHVMVEGKEVKWCEETRMHKTKAQHRNRLHDVSLYSTLK